MFRTNEIINNTHTLWIPPPPSGHPVCVLSGQWLHFRCVIMSWSLSLSGLGEDIFGRWLEQKLSAAPTVTVASKPGPSRDVIFR